MSNRQLDEIGDERIAKKLTIELGITVDELEELVYDFDTFESKSGHVGAQIIIFRDGSPKHILNKIEAIDDNNTVYLDPWFFEEPDE